MLKSNTKEVKLHDMYRYGNSRKQDRIVPVLRLEGDWLEDLGFHAGEAVVITYSKDKLVIKPKLSRSEYKKAQKEWDNPNNYVRTSRVAINRRGGQGGHT